MINMIIKTCDNITKLAWINKKFDTYQWRGSSCVAEPSSYCLLLLRGSSSKTGRRHCKRGPASTEHANGVNGKGARAGGAWLGFLPRGRGAFISLGEIKEGLRCTTRDDPTVRTTHGLIIALVLARM